ncbi:MAG: penicillin-binding protein [Microbacteriaceae bacterium]|nr:penicillin-binding protein [Microbacteriaceae bacterium]
MNKQLKAISRTVFAMFIVLFFSVTMIQFVAADELRDNEYNQRSIKNSYKVERGSILVAGNPVAYSTPTGDEFRFQRQYADGPMYAPITGYFSRYQGMTGLESAMNQQLSGLSGSQFFTRLLRTITGEEPQGNSVETTILPEAQAVAWEGLAGFEGAAVALDYETGEILAMASSPSYDPSLLSLNSNAQVIANSAELEGDPDNPLFNRTIGGDLYHPGSTYKLIVAAAAIESGAATPESTFPDPATLQLPQSSAVLTNSWNGTCSDGTETTLMQAMVRSCNIPIAELTLSMDRNVVPDMARAFGFEQELSVPLTVTPSVAPNPTDGAQAALSSIGQLDVRSTPLQIAMVSAGIANDGVVMQPELVSRVITPDLRTESAFEPTELSTPISPSTATSMQSMMEQVVTAPNGSARAAQIEGARVGGKTGTAENGLDANGDQLPYTLWFTGYAERDDRRVAVAVVIENGGGAAHGFAGSSQLSVEIGKQIMEAVLNQ